MTSPLASRFKDLPQSKGSEVEDALQCELVLPTAAPSTAQHTDVIDVHVLATKSCINILLSASFKSKAAQRSDPVELHC